MKISTCIIVSFICQTKMFITLSSQIFRNKAIKKEVVNCRVALLNSQTIKTDLDFLLPGSHYLNLTEAFLSQGESDKF